MADRITAGTKLCRKHLADRVHFRKCISGRASADAKRCGQLVAER